MHTVAMIFELIINKTDSIVKYLPYVELLLIVSCFIVDEAITISLIDFAKLLMSDIQSIFYSK